ncbi:MAG: pyridoxamine 5'-phosphate oxidase family protein [Oscillospiraceae bacterium]|nr:pyridoxamine 5'-phosphate oxidase family protein [Oscillospiraceae bacterium]
MQKVYEFLKKSGAFYLATAEGNQPRVRPFGAVNVFEGKLYIQTGKVKKVYKQMKTNPKVEICGMVNEQWIRIEATVVEDDRVEASQSLLDAYPILNNRYHAGDGNCTVFYLKDATATIYSMEAEPEVIHF